MVSIEEQETHISFGRSDDRAVIYTSDSTTMTKLDKLIDLPGTEWKLESITRVQSGEIVGKTYSCPVVFVSFRSKKRDVNMTEEQRQKISERVKHNLDSTLSR